MKEHILVIDDEPDILELVRYNLAKEGYQVSVAPNGEDGLKVCWARVPDVALVDLMLPGIDGLEVVRSIRGDARTKGLPVIIISAKGEEADVVSGLELGADDYLVKPFSARVLGARIKSVLRRNKVSLVDENSIINIDGLKVDPSRFEVLIDEAQLELTATEFKLLHFLASRRGLVYTRSQIVDAVHGDDYPVTDRSVDVQVVGLRRKLGEFGPYIETVRGIGYRFRG